MNTVQVHDIVWAQKSHGIFRRVPRGTYGTILDIRSDGQCLVEWINGQSSTIPAHRLAHGPEVDPHYAALIEQALASTELQVMEHPQSQDWQQGWNSARTAIREALTNEGLIHKSTNKEALT